MMASKYWIKLYIEILDDPKMGSLKDFLWRRAVELMLVAGEGDGTGTLPAVTQLAWRLRVDEKDLVKSLWALSEIGFVHQEGDRWIVTNFIKRQEKATEVERKRQQRSREKKDEYYHCHENVTNRDTDIDTEIETEYREEREKENNNNYCGDDLKLMVDAFVDMTKIPGSMADESWMEAFKIMHKAGVRPEDIPRAVQVLHDKKYPVVGPKSIIKTAISIMSTRINTKKPVDDDYKRYLKGEFGNVGVY